MDRRCAISGCNNEPISYSGVFCQHHQNIGASAEDAVPGDTIYHIIKICDEIKEMLLEKNRKYGNSALKPLRLFSKADTIEQLNVRIDDKLSRIRSGQTDDDEDAENDLIGYLILKRVARYRSRWSAE